LATRGALGMRRQRCTNRTGKKIGTCATSRSGVRGFETPGRYFIASLTYRSVMTAE
jgi:hypothetical protein